MQKPLSPKSPLRSQSQSIHQLIFPLGTFPWILCLSKLSALYTCLKDPGQGLGAQWLSFALSYVTSVCSASCLPLPLFTHLFGGWRRAHLPLPFSKDYFFSPNSLKNLKPREKLEFYNQHTYFKYFTTYTLSLSLPLSLFSVALPIQFYPCELFETYFQTS